jgi:3',5'-cyclic-nucleotide phosphodiesterase
MDYATCNVVYVDRAAKEDRLVKKEDAIPAAPSIDFPNRTGDHALDRRGSATLDANLQTLLATFGEGLYREFAPLVHC